MSRRREQTREKILEAAQALLEREGSEATGMSEVAALAGVSRQAVYLHFASRSGLLLALVDRVDQRFGLSEAIAEVEGEPDPRRALLRSQELTARYAPRIHACAMALADARRRDPDARAAYEGRMALRLQGLRRITDMIERAGLLAPGWASARAAEACWALGLPEVYQALVVERGWSEDEYTRYLCEGARALCDRG